MSQSVLNSFLKAIGAKYTKEYLSTLYKEHPNKNNMYGLKMILHNYGIETKGLFFSDKENAELTFPCILHIKKDSSDFVSALELDADKITYVLNSKRYTKNVPEFCEMWTGNALVCESAVDNVIEPDYWKNVLTGAVNTLSLFACIGIPVLLGLLAAFNVKEGIIPIKSLVDTILNLVGMTFCLFLLERQIKKVSRFGDAVCSCFGHKSCASVLDSEWAKIGNYSWSEIGFAYFMARFLMCIFLPNCANELLIINLFAMMFSLYSLWIQARKIHDWCVQCIIIQSIIWTIGIFDILYGTFSLLSFSIFIPHIIICGLLFVLIVILTNKVVSSYQLKNEYQEEVALARSVKADVNYFNFKLNSEREIEIPDTDKCVSWGNPDSKLVISVYTNPFCSHCKKMHKRLEKLQHEANHSFLIKYIYEPFTEKIDLGTRMLIAAHQQLDKDLEDKVYKEWFHDGNVMYNEYIEKYHLDVYSEDVNKIINYTREWKLKAGFNSTPIVMVNGHLMPVEYDVEDLIYFIE